LGFAERTREGFRGLEVNGDTRGNLRRRKQTASGAGRAVRCIMRMVRSGSARLDMWPGVRTEPPLTDWRKRQHQLRYYEQAD
jgi:hypothetical protein